MDGYQRRKYVAKMIYIYLLGYEVDFGHGEIIKLASSLKYSEKQMVRILENDRG
jgi:AP-2 complex subunit alpha